MKILNLYACLGGNRYKWEEVNPNIEITAIELDPELCKLYKERFPNDEIIQTDAHQYLLDHYKEFDFIWSSPPCPSHSRARFWGSKGGQVNPVYPEMQLYQEIIFLKHFFAGKWVIENVTPYYEPLIKQTEKIGRHLYWSNFELPKNLQIRKDKAGERGKNELINLCEFHDFDFYKYKGIQRKVKIARNLVDYEVGKAIFQAANQIKTQNQNNQIQLL